MIRVIHGDEPTSLAAERARRVAKLKKRWDAQGLDSGDARAIDIFRKDHDAELDGGYRTQAWETLRRHWRRRCAYCTAELHDSDPIDHFRPRRPHRGEHGGYWWLTWSWRNLLPACQTCNTSKDNDFPIRGKRLRPWAHATDGERSTLIDPSEDFPHDHLEFVREEVNGRERWTLQGKDLRGRKTVEVLGLDEDDERYETHLERLRELIVDLEDKRAQGPEVLRKYWRRKTKVLVAAHDAPEGPAQPYPALSCAYLRHHFGEVMSTLSLELPALDDPRTPSPRAPLLPERAGFLGLEESLRLEILSLGRRPRVERTRAVLLRLVETRSWSLDELVELLPQSSQALRAHLRTLRDAGTLCYDGERVWAVARAASPG